MILAYRYRPETSRSDDVCPHGDERRKPGGVVVGAVLVAPIPHFSSHFRNLACAQHSCDVPADIGTDTPLAPPSPKCVINDVKPPSTHSDGHTTTLGAHRSRAPWTLPCA